MTPWLGTTRVRLALAYSGIFSVVALLAAGALSLAIARIEYKAIDDSLASEAASLQSTLVTGGPLPGTGSAADAATQSRGVGIGAVLFDGGTKVLDTSGQGPAAGALEPVAQRALTSDAAILETQTIDGIKQRIRASPIQVRTGETRVLVLTRSTSEADQVAGTTATVLLLGTIVLVIAATVLGYGLAGTALRPVREIVAAARALGEQDLHRRIELDLPADELGELADTFNGMLARLETAFDSLSRFTADAAHELRAPLTLIRTEAEVTLSRPRTAEEYQASLATVLAETQRLGRMADQLLLLARAEAGALGTHMENVDLGLLVDETVRIWQPLAAERGVAVVSRTDELCAAWGDADLLRRLLDNLIDNALRHSPAASEIRVTSRRADQDLELAVEDAGPGVPDAAQGSIFERFSRADQSRTRETGGAGLGLALCAAIAQLHHGSIALEPTGSRGARFVVRLPPAPSVSH